MATQPSATPHSHLLGITRKENGRLMNQWWQEMAAADAEGRPVANVFVLGSMAEILNTFDIPICFPEMTSLQTAVRGRSMEYLAAAEDQGYSPDICGYVKVDVGLHTTGRDHPNGKLPKPSLVVACNLCNTYVKWSEIWERIYGCPVFVLDLPGVRGRGYQYSMDTATFRNDCRYVEGQIRELIALCEQVTGKKFDIDRLREVMGQVNQQAVSYQQVLEQNKHRPAPFNAMRDGVVFMGVSNAFRGRPEGTTFLQTALTELQERARLGIGAIPEEKFRLFFVGVACYTHFRRFMELFEQWGGNFVHSEYMAFAGGGIDKGINYDLRRPLESLAEQILFTSMTSMSNMFFSHEWQADVVRAWGADGMVFHGVKSCRTTSTGLADSREWHVSTHNVPSLLIESDLVDQRLWSEAQMRNRIDAFFESLATRKAAAQK